MEKEYTARPTIPHFLCGGPLGLQAPDCDQTAESSFCLLQRPVDVLIVVSVGGLGSIGGVFEAADELRGQIERVRELTDRPFVVNHVVPALDEEA